MSTRNLIVNRSQVTTIVILRQKNYSGNMIGCPCFLVLERRVYLHRVLRFRMKKARIHFPGRFSWPAEP